MLRSKPSTLGGGFLPEIIPIQDSILYAGTCQILPNRAEGGNSHADKDTCLGCLLIGLTNRERGSKNEERMLML